MVKIYLSTIETIGYGLNYRTRRNNIRLSSGQITGL